MIKYYSVSKATPLTPGITLPDKLYTTGTLPALSVLSGDIPGSIAWDAYTIKEGTHGYTWIFIPAAEYLGNYNIVTGTLQFTAVVPVIKELRLSQGPEKTSYTAFEQFDITGIILRITSEDDESALFDLMSDDLEYQLIYNNGGIFFRAGEKYIILKYKDKSVEIAVTAGKAQGAVIDTVTVAAVDGTKITLNASEAGNGQQVEYAISENNSAPLYAWQTELVFDSLKSGTTYYVFARAKSDSDYVTGAASEGLEVKTEESSGSNKGGCAGTAGFFSTPSNPYGALVSIAVTAFFVFTATVIIRRKVRA